MRWLKRLRERMRNTEIKRSEAALRYIPYRPAELGRTRGKK